MSPFGPVSFFGSGREAVGDANFVLAILKEGEFSEGRRLVLGERAISRLTVRLLLKLEIGVVSTNKNKPRCLDT